MILEFYVTEYYSIIAARCLVELFFSWIGGKRYEGKMINIQRSIQVLTMVLSFLLVVEIEL